MKKALLLILPFLIPSAHAGQTTKKAATPLIIAATTGIASIYLYRLGKENSIDATALHDESYQLSLLGLPEDSQAVLSRSQRIERRASKMKMVAGIAAGVSILTGAFGLYVVATDGGMMLRTRLKF